MEQTQETINSTDNHEQVQIQEPERLEGKELEKAISSLKDEELENHLSKARTGNFEPKVPIQPETPKKEDKSSVNWEKQITEMKSFIGKQSSEIGELRKLLQQKQESPPEPEPELQQTAQDFFDNPQGHVEQLVKKMLNSDQIAQVVDKILEIRSKDYQERTEKENQYRQETFSQVTKVIPNVKDFLNIMADLALEDGVSKEIVEQFKQDPWNENPAALINLAKRAMITDELSAIKKGKGYISAKPSRVINGNLGRGSLPLQSASPNQISKMTDKELDDYFEQLKHGRG